MRTQRRGENYASGEVQECVYTHLSSAKKISVQVAHLFNLLRLSNIRLYSSGKFIRISGRLLTNQTKYLCI